MSDTRCGSRSGRHECELNQGHRGLHHGEEHFPGGISIDEWSDTAADAAPSAAAAEED